jgi:HPt (histidine-containing phosphotransfer) domain-containing protein
LVALYFDEMPAAIAALQTALAANDARAVASHAHTVKAVAANLSAQSVSVLAEHLESLVTHDATVDFAGWQFELMQAYGELNTLIEQFSKDLG